MIHVQSCWIPDSLINRKTVVTVTFDQFNHFLLIKTSNFFWKNKQTNKLLNGSVFCAIDINAYINTYNAYIYAYNYTFVISTIKHIEHWNQGFEC